MTKETITSICEAIHKANLMLVAYDCNDTRFLVKAEKKMCEIYEENEALKETCKIHAETNSKLSEEFYKKNEALTNNRFCDMTKLELIRLAQSQGQELRKLNEKIINDNN